MFFVLLISVLAASLNSTVLHKARLSGDRSIYLYNLIGAAVWCISLFAVNGCRLHLDASILLWGCIYGMTQALLILFKTAAMNQGPVSVTTLIGNCSLLLSVVGCLILWHEPISLADIGGLALLLLGIFLTTAKTTGGRFTKKWLICALLFLVCGAGLGITFKAFSKSGVGYTGDMMLAASCVMLATYSFLYMITKERASAPGIFSKKEKRAFMFTALISGLCSCLYNRLNIYLSGVMDGVIFFPTFNGGVIVLSTVFSVILLKEKLSAKQLAGIIIGIMGIFIIGVL